MEIPSPEWGGQGRGKTPFANNRATTITDHGRCLHPNDFIGGSIVDGLKSTEAEMPNRKLLAVCILIAVAAAIVPGRAARSDAAPPREPPAGNVWPAAGTTMVQMTAENVTLWIRPASGKGYVAAVTADFNFRNQGTAAESMQVRFPMEPVNGGGDGYGGRPLIRNFAAKTGGAALPITTVEEPFEDGPAVAWSTFPVTFPAGKDVFLRVTYETGFSSGHYGDSWLDYILETGAGWYGNIGSAVVTYRFPYAVGPLNVPVQEQAVRTGSEVRFLFSEFEPDFLSNIRLEFLHPAVWQKVLDLEHATGENPKDVRSVVQLAAEYQDLCMLAGTDASLLAETIVLEGLTYSPESADLHAEWANIFLDRLLPMCSGFDRSETLAGLRRELNLALSLDPENELALEVQQVLAENYPELLGTPEPAPATAVAATKTPTEVKIKTETATRFPVTKTATVFETPTVEALPPGPEPSGGIPAGWLIGAGIAGVVLGLIVPSSWKRRATEKL
jgi:hypothetical protein